MSLSSLIVQREIASMRAVEEALARQVLYGGDLVTNLLEVAAVDEAKLNAVAAEDAGIAAGPTGVLPPPADERARRTLPPDLAARRSIYPLSMSPDSEHLVVAIAEPFSPEEEEQLMFALGVPIAQRLVPLVRIKQALAREFGTPLERRFERLSMRLAGEHVTWSSRPPLLHEAPPAPLPPGPDLMAKPGFLAAPPLPRKVTSAGFPAVRPDAPALATSAGAENAIVPNRILTLGATPAELPPPPAPRAPIPQSTATPTDVESLPPVVSSEPRTDRDDRPRTSSGRPIDAAARATLLRNIGASPRPARRRLRPLTFNDARKELEDVVDRDGILDLVFDFGRQFFDYSALFVVHGDIAEGRDAYGPGASRDQVVGIGVPLDMPSLLQTARNSKQPVIDVPSREGLDSVMLGDLHRGARATVAVIPVVVRTRAVAMLYGDASDVGVTHEAVTDVAAFALLAGQAFEKLILKKKLGGFTGGSASSNDGRIGARASTIPSKGAPAKAPSVPPHISDRPQHPDPLPRSNPPPMSTRTSDIPLPLAQPRSVKRPSDRSQRAEALGRALFTNATVSVTTGESPMAESVSPKELAAQQASVDEFTVPRRRGQTPTYDSGADDTPTFALTTMPRPSGRPLIPREDPADATLRAPERVYGGEDRARPVSTSETSAEDSDTTLEELAVDGFLEDTAFPPSQAAISVPPHSPPSSHSAEKEGLPSVIVEVAPEVTQAVERYLADPRDEHAQAEIVRLGEQAMPAIMARFPGPTTAQPKLDEEEPPPVSTCGPILRAIAAERRIALPFVLPHLNVTDENARFWATYLISELPYVEAIAGVLPRLHDPVERIRKAARLAIRAIDRAHGDVVARELGRIVKDSNAEKQRRALMIDVLEELREPQAVPAFIHAMADGAEDLAQIARRALCTLTRQDFGTDIQRWASWWQKNGQRHRIEWLIDALVHDTPSIRNAAGEELKTITKEYFGYYDDLPRREREKAQHRYREWWQTTGRARFAS